MSSAGSWMRPSAGGARREAAALGPLRVEVGENPSVLAGCRGTGEGAIARRGAAAP